MDSLISSSSDLFSRLSFTSAVLISVYFIRRTNIDPNPLSATTIASPKKADFLMSARNKSTMRRHLHFLIATGIYHTLVSALPHTQRQTLCPAYNPGGSSRYGSSVDQGLFTWTPYTTSVLAVLISAGVLRMATYSNLGTSFTFHITKPKSGLKTTGLHRYIRHPSYTGLLLVGLAMTLLLFRANGLMGCWFPVQVAGVLDKGMLLWTVLVNPILFGLRVRQEEEFLMGAFGEEWRRYCAQTRRFVPGLF